MNIVLTALIAGSTLLPDIDRQSLELQARAEALRATGSQATVRRAAGGGPLDLTSLATICRAAGNQSDPAAFLATLSRAYSMSREESASLRSSCAAYLAGQADARQSGRR
jgi:hypothetical protein